MPSNESAKQNAEMAIRSRTSTPVQYDDFLPKYEWKEETGSRILTLYLPPEFKKEQIRITYVQSTRMIRVNGERPLVNNKWSRFNQGFPLPQDSDVNNIEARYQNGVLTLTMPKTKPATAPQQPISTEETKPPQQVTPPTPPKQPAPTTPPTPPKQPAPTTARKQADEKTTATATTATASTQKPAPEPKPQKGVENSSSLDDLKDRTTKKGQDGTTENVSPPKDTVERKHEATLPQEDESSKKRREKAVSESSADKESSKKGKEPTTDVKSDVLKKENGEDKAIEEFIAEKVKLVKGLANAAKRNIQEFSMDVNEDRQAMVNIGVAVLVIVALGTYIYYSRGSSRTAK